MTKPEIRFRGDLSFLWIDRKPVACMNWEGLTVAEVIAHWKTWAWWAWSPKKGQK